MENGLYIGTKTDDRVKSVHIDQEVLEFARLNRATEARRREAALAAVKETRSAKNRQRGRNHMMAQNAALVGAAAIVSIGAALGMPSAWIAAMVVAMVLAAVSFRVGRWFGK